jgi:subtilisin family serine protease
MLRYRPALSLRQILFLPLLAALAVPVQAAAPEGSSLPAHARDRVIVGFDAGSRRAERRLALNRAQAASSKALSPIAANVVVAELEVGQSVTAAIKALERRPAVAYAEPDFRVWPAVAADDPHVLDGSLWGMYGPTTTPHASAWGSAAAVAWAGGQVGSPDIHIGIIDEGIRIDHPDLEANIWRNPVETVDGVDEDGNGYIDDVAGWDFYHDDASVYDSTADDHGTHVAGTIGARGGNGRGVAGVTWRATLIPAKFLGPGGGYVSDAVRALDYITDLKSRHGLDIVATNNSWSGGGYSQALKDAIARAGDAGILFVAAAGNDGRDLDEDPAYPGSYRCDSRADGSARGWDCVVTVANLRSDGQLQADSGWGRSSVDLAAPGTGILSTHPAGEEGYDSRSGTSMAAAHVSGAIAACAAADPSLPARRIREAILATAAPAVPLAGRTLSGAHLDVGAMVSACTPAPLPTLTVDDGDAAFRRYGAGWYEGSGGFAGHHFWASVRETTRTLYGAWRPVLATGGWYEVQVHIPVEHATSHSARYRVRTSTGWVTRVRNQEKRRGTWVSLGVHHLATTPIVQLSDRTGEIASLGRQLAFDAARFVPVDGPSPGDSPAREADDG